MTRLWEVRQISGSELEKLERVKAGLTGEEPNTGEGRAKGLKARLKPSIFNVYPILWRAVLNLFHYTVTYGTYFIEKTSLVNKKLKM